jgi:hypothetical protein
VGVSVGADSVGVNIHLELAILQTTKERGLQNARVLLVAARAPDARFDGSRKPPEIKELQWYF